MAILSVLIVFVLLATAAGSLAMTGPLFPMSSRGGSSSAALSGSSANLHSPGATTTAQSQSILMPALGQPSSDPGRIIKTLSYQDQGAPYPIPLSGAYDPTDSTIYSGSYSLSAGSVSSLLEANVSAVSLPSARPAVAYPYQAVALNTSNGYLILAEQNSSNNALYLQQFNPASDSVTASLPVSPVKGSPANVLYDPVNGLVYVLTANALTNNLAGNLTIYNPATNLVNANPPTIDVGVGFLAESMTFNANYSVLFLAGIIENGASIYQNGVLAINISNYSEHLISIPGTFGAFSEAVGGIVYDPFDGFVYFSYSSSSPTNTTYFPEGIGVINASTQTYALSFSMPNVISAMSPSKYGPNIAGSLTYNPDNHDLYLTQNGLSWQHGTFYNKTIAVINGTSPTSANPVVLLPTSSYQIGGMFIPSQSSGEGGSLWFPSIGVNTTIGQVGNYTVAGVPPEISSLSLSHAVIDEGSGVTLTSSVSFGVGTLTYSYSGLPSGIVSQNLNSISGVPNVSGTFNIKLTVTDAAGESTVATVQLIINPVFSATVAYTPGTVDAGQLVQFTVTTTGGTAPFAGYWTFGDGSAGTGLSQYHIFRASGSYTVSAKVTDALGNSYTAITSITVSLPPANATILASSSVTDAGMAVTLSAESQFGSTPLTYAWNLGNGNTSTAHTLTSTYSSPGTYTVTLTVTDVAGETASSSYTILVLPDPQVTVNSVSTVTANTSTTFGAITTGGLAPYSYAWNFGDGTQSTQQMPQHTFSGKGAYTVSVKVTDSAGYSTTSSVNITVTQSSISTRTSSGGTSSTPNSSMGYLLLGGGLIAGFVVGAVVIAILSSRRRNQGPPPEMK